MGLGIFRRFNLSKRGRTPDMGFPVAPIGISRAYCHEGIASLKEAYASGIVSVCFPMGDLAKGREVPQGDAAVQSTRSQPRTIRGEGQGDVANELSGKSMDFSAGLDVP